MPPLIFRVVQQDGAWSVEHEGALSNRSPDKAVVIASATKLARAAISAGRPVQVRIEGETGYF
jgi:phosphotransferase system HPr-like phosphotransfer protein